MSDVFEAAVKIVLLHEGGYADNPHDPGGETNFGISKRAYPDEDIRGMTALRAAEIYHRDYWLRCRMDELPAPVATKLLDAAVLAGRHGAVAALQRALGAPVVADGAMGPQTIQACQAASAAALLTAFRQELANHFEAIVAANPDEELFLDDWLRRAAA